MTRRSRRKNLAIPPVFRPSRNDPCLCGSGLKFKKCCAERLPGTATGSKVQEALKQQRYDEALLECRAEITQYTIWHKSHTEPGVQKGLSAIKPLLDIDIKALGELVDYLFHCYIKTDQIDKFPATLECLRANINDSRWHRKVTYFQALSALGPDWNVNAGRRELQKLGSFEDEEDVETLQLYIDLFRNDLSFSENQKFIDRIIDLTDKASDRLHYKGTRAVEYFLIGDARKAESELSEAISDFRGSVSLDDAPDYGLFRLALSLELLGALRNDGSLLNDSITAGQKLLDRNNLTPSGRADIYRLIGDVYRHKAEWGRANEVYKLALKEEPKTIFNVFISECFLRMGKVETAQKLILKLDFRKLDKHEFEDYAFILAAISIETGKRELLEKAKSALKNLNELAPYFQKRCDALLLNVVETQKSGKSEKIIHRTRELFSKIVKSASSYLLLQPNFMGIGVDVGKLLNDANEDKRKHINQNLDKQTEVKSSPPRT